MALETQTNTYFLPKLRTKCLNANVNRLYQTHHCGWNLMPHSVLHPAISNHQLFATWKAIQLFKKVTKPSSRGCSFQIEHARGKSVKAKRTEISFDEDKTN